MRGAGRRQPEHNGHDKYLNRSIPRRFGRNHLFAILKEGLAAQCFTSDEEVKKAVTNWTKEVAEFRNLFRGMLNLLAARTLLWTKLVHRVKFAVRASASPIGGDKISRGSGRTNRHNGACFCLCPKCNISTCWSETVSANVEAATYTTTTITRRETARPAGDSTGPLQERTPVTLVTREEAVGHRPPPGWPPGNSQDLRRLPLSSSATDVPVPSDLSS
ncbi:hypothetical protein AAG570_012381 [Ranatra chinensis]|uniref:Uncharacterized protein n=1 Tax=Ranatra chinensis TaxID=642074 RepID=A0ABD0Z703_9HEMI